MPLPPRTSLQYNQILGVLPLAVRNALYAKSEYRTYKKGEYIYREGDTGPYFLGCMMSGRVRAVLRSREGHEYLMAIIEKSELFGEMSFFDQAPRPCDIIADQKSTIMILQADDLMPYLLACPEAIKAVFRLGSRRTRTYVRRLELLAIQSVKQKLGRHLIHLAQDHGREDPQGSITIIHKRSQADIAARLGITRESVNKQLNSFIQQGLILYSSKHIVLRDIEGLKKAIASPSRTKK